MKIMGYKKVDFTGDDNVKISGYTVFLFAEYDKQINGIIRGCFADKIFLSEEKFKALMIDELYEAQKDVLPLYNRFGKLERFI